MPTVTGTIASLCGLQALVKVALCRRVLHPNIVPVLGVAEYPTTKEMLLVRMRLLFHTRHNCSCFIIALTPCTSALYSASEDEQSHMALLQNPTETQPFLIV